MDNDKFTIKQWAEEDRPREKMLSKGVRALSSAELLAIIIGSGNKKLTAVDLSKLILNDVGNSLNALGRKSIEELTANYNGIGEAKAISILACMELGRRRESEVGLKLTQIVGSSSVVEIFQPLLSDLPHEEFWVLYLNRANKIIGRENISKGGVSGTVVDTKIIFKSALEKLASAIILCHNHPSGSLHPSSPDISITKKCFEAGKVLGIDVLDHVIVANTGSYSFADQGMMPS